MHRVIYLITLLSTAKLLESSANLTITGQIECENSPHVTALTILINSQENAVNVDRYGYFGLKVPQNQTVILKIDHPHCNFHPVAVNTDIRHGMQRFVYLRGDAKVRTSWWRTPSIMVFFVLNILVVVAFWAMTKYRRKMVFVREIDVEDGIRFRKE